MRDGDHDEALLADLAEALRETRPFAPGVADRAGRAPSPLDLIDEELLTAQLSFDSDHAPASTSRRSEPAAESRVLVFTTELRSVEVEVLPDRILGQFIPPSGGEVEVEDEHGVIATAHVDEWILRRPAGSRGPRPTALHDPDDTDGHGLDPSVSCSRAEGDERLRREASDGIGLDGAAGGGEGRPEIGAGEPAVEFEHERDRARVVHGHDAGHHARRAQRHERADDPEDLVGARGGPRAPSRSWRARRGAVPDAAAPGRRP